MCYGNPDTDCTNEEIEADRKLWKEYYKQRGLVSPPEKKRIHEEVRSAV